MDHSPIEGPPDDVVREFEEALEIYAGLYKESVLAALGEEERAPALGDRNVLLPSGGERASGPGQGPGEKPRDP